MSDDLVHQPKITTLAKPPGKVLVAARFEVQRNLTIRATFEEYKGRSPDQAQRLADEVVPLMGEEIEGSESEIREVCRYLADEYLQIGDSILIIDPETGTAIARITEEDFWEPPEVPREYGEMVKPPSRLRPDLQGFLVRWSFEKDREKKLVEELTQRLTQTPADIELGDRRLLATTRKGRKSISDKLGADLPNLIPSAVGGGLRKFIDLLRIGKPPEGSTLTEYAGLTAYARTSLGIQDGKARNLQFDVPVFHKSTVAIQWAREVARTVSTIAHKDGLKTNVAFPPTPSTNLWIASPDASLALTREGSISVPVEGALPMSLRGTIGYLVLGRTEVAHREVHDRWDIAATLEYTLFLDVGALSPVVLTDLPSPVVNAVLVQ